MTANKYDIVHNGEAVGLVNSALLKRRGVEHNLEAIIDLHQYKLSVHDEIRKESDVKVLRMWVLVLESTEYQLQELWGLPRDSTYHRFWETPKCTCPKMDNMERYGTGYSVINKSCILHGD